MSVYQWLAERDQIPSGTGVERRAWAHRHPVRVIVGWTVCLGTFFMPIALAGGWPMVALCYVVSLLTGLGFQRSTERLHRADVRRVQQER